MSATEFELTPAPQSVRELVKAIWGSRTLLRLLARKDFYAKYRRASLGMLWAIGLPLSQAVVFSVIFSRVVRIKVEGNYGIFAFAGVLPWTYFLSSVGTGTTSIVDGRALASKTYFPRAVLPLVVVVVELYGLVWGTAVLLVGAATFGPGLGWDAFLLLPASVMLVALSAAFALMLSGLYVYFRDLQYVVQAVTRAWFYVTPILYPLSLVPEGKLRTVMQANPSTGVVQLFRASIGYPEPGLAVSLAWSGVWIIGMLAIAVVLHQRHDRVFVDLL